MERWVGRAVFVVRDSDVVAWSLVACTSDLVLS